MWPTRTVPPFSNHVITAWQQQHLVLNIITPDRKIMLIVEHLLTDHSLQNRAAGNTRRQFRSDPTHDLRYPLFSILFTHEIDPVSPLSNSTEFSKTARVLSQTLPSPFSQPRMANHGDHDASFWSNFHILRLSSEGIQHVQSALIRSHITKSSKIWQMQSGIDYFHLSVSHVWYLGIIF